uniref:Uncharacterized protein n=1 Tax=Glossina austeni TaxID=7395 RepID=A0A1A9UV88_GLOAU
MNLLFTRQSNAKICHFIFNFRVLLMTKNYGIGAGTFCLFLSATVLAHVGIFYAIQEEATFKMKPQFQRSMRKISFPFAMKEPEKIVNISSAAKGKRIAYLVSIGNKRLTHSRPICETVCGTDFRGYIKSIAHSLCDDNDEQLLVFLSKVIVEIRLVLNLKKDL